MFVNTKMAPPPSSFSQRKKPPQLLEHLPSGGLKSALRYRLKRTHTTAVQTAPYNKKNHHRCLLHSTGRLSQLKVLHVLQEAARLQRGGFNGRGTRLDGRGRGRGHDGAGLDRGGHGRRLDTTTTHRGGGRVLDGRRLLLCLLCALLYLLLAQRTHPWTLDHLHGGALLLLLLRLDSFLGLDAGHLRHFGVCHLGHRVLRLGHFGNLSAVSCCLDTRLDEGQRGREQG